MLATDPRPRHRARPTGYWLGQSSAMRPASRRVRGGGASTSAVCAAVLLLLAALSQAA